MICPMNENYSASPSKSSLYFWGLGLLLLLIFLYFSPGIDLAIARYFYHPETHHFSNLPFFHFMYQWGVLPAQIVSIASAIVLVLSYVIRSWKKWRNPSLLLVLTMALGAGFITHSVLKDHWGRPRPRQVIEFGGTQPFHPIYEPHFTLGPDQYKSFPCGHCTMGFYFIGFIFLGKRLNNRILFWSGVILTLGLGIVLSITRMGQGGHFFSDTAASALIMWLTTYLCDWLIFSNERIT